MSKNKLYLHPKYYDIAFDFRDLRKEHNFMTRLYQKTVGRSPRSIVDIACGPAYHAIYFSKKNGIDYSYGLDLSEAMVAYAREKNEIEGGTARIVRGDMIDFKLPRKVDMAMCMIASIHMLTTNEELLKHLDSVARNLNPDGLYIVELQHPRDNFEEQEDDTNIWDMELNGTKVFVQWGTDDDPFDPITQVHETSVTMQVKEKGEKRKTFTFTDPYRIIPYQEFMLLIKCSGKFKYLGSYGKFDLRKKMDTSEASWRMIAVLQKK
ncbi:MAG TPA: class I SAM-dependent methyltransferase [candidate division Zixibacteria bacterium]|nr:class I SAM-dependent methyltransferase [candidate division Zixibacteria bacterium]HER00105.1 class I SAM-dependent methyltransferase [candidate division Zixibacteria bacterium]